MNGNRDFRRNNRNIVFICSITGKNEWDAMHGKTTSHPNRISHEPGFGRRRKTNIGVHIPGSGSLTLGQFEKPKYRPGHLPRRYPTGARTMYPGHLLFSGTGNARRHSGRDVCRKTGLDLARPNRPIAMAVKLLRHKAVVGIFHHTVVSGPPRFHGG